MGVSAADIRGRGAFAIAPSDTATYDPPIWRIFVGATGDVKVDTKEATGVVYKSVPTGTYITCNATKVYAAGTTATQLVGEA